MVVHTQADDARAVESHVSADPVPLEEKAGAGAWVGQLGVAFVLGVIGLCLTLVYDWGVDPDTAGRDPRYDPIFTGIVIAIIGVFFVFGYLRHFYRRPIAAPNADESGAIASNASSFSGRIQLHNPVAVPWLETSAAAAVATVIWRYRRGLMLRFELTGGFSVAGNDGRTLRVPPGHVAIAHPLRCRHSRRIGRWDAHYLLRAVGLGDSERSPIRFTSVRLFELHDGDPVTVHCTTQPAPASSTGPTTYRTTATVLQPTGMVHILPG